MEEKSPKQEVDPNGPLYEKVLANEKKGINVNEEKVEAYKKLEIEWLKKALNVPSDEERPAEEIYKEMQNLNPYNPYSVSRGREYLEQRLKELDSTVQISVQPEPIPEVVPEQNTEPESKLEPEPLIQEEQKQPEETVKTNENSELDKAQMKEWEELEDLRDQLLKVEAKKNKDSTAGLTLELQEARSKYESARTKIAESIKQQARIELSLAVNQPLPEEEKAAVNEIIFDKLIKEENRVYIEMLKATRGETLGDKVKESLKNALSTKAVQWYLGLSKWQRMALSFSLGATAGLVAGAGVGALGVAGYIGKRVLTGVAGVSAGEWARKHWSAEELEQAEEKETNDLKNSELSVEEKSKNLQEIENRYKKEKIKMTAKRIGVTAAAGMGAGFLSNFAESLMTSDGIGSSVQPVESTGNKTSSSILENRTLGRKGFAPVQTKAAPLSESVMVPEPKAEDVVVTPEVPENIISDQSVLHHEVIAGDSAWKVLGKTLDNNEQFKGMSEAQKTYVLSALNNKILKDPADYGLESDGSLQIGKQVDLTKLFENNKGVQTLLNEAKDKIVEGGPQEESILINNQKITNWVEAHPNESLNEERVSEILNSKPVVKPEIESIAESKVISPEPIDMSGPKTLVEPIEPIVVPENKPFVPLDNTIKPIVESELDIPNNPQPLGGGEAVGAISAASMAGVVSVDSFKKDKEDKEMQKRQEIENDIQSDKQKLAQLENSSLSNISNFSAEGRNNPNIRSFTSDSLAQRAKVNSNQMLEMLFRKELDNIYGKKGFIGIGKEAGIDSKEWGRVSRLSAKGVLEFWTGDSTKSGLSMPSVEEISKPIHDVLRRQVVGLIEGLTNKMREKNPSFEIKAYDNENLGDFFKRLGDLALKVNLQEQQLQKAA
jgi:hypothetical protein